MSHTAKQKQKIRKRCARSAMISLTISQIRRLESEVGNDVVYSFAKLMFGNEVGNDVADSFADLMFGRRGWQ